MLGSPNMENKGSTLLLTTLKSKQTNLNTILVKLLLLPTRLLKYVKKPNITTMKNPQLFIHIFHTQAFVINS